MRVRHRARARSATPRSSCHEGAREMGTETENEETENCLGTEGGGEKIRVSIGDGHLDRESEAGRAASERRIAKTKARAERG